MTDTISIMIVGVVSAVGVATIIKISSVINNFIFDLRAKLRPKVFCSTCKYYNKGYEGLCGKVKKRNTYLEAEQLFYGDARVKNRFNDCSDYEVNNAQTKTAIINVPEPDCETKEIIRG